MPALPGELIQRAFQVFTNPTSVEPKFDATETAIATLMMDRLTGWSFLIEIGASSRSREKSAQIANAVATAYIDDQQEAKRDANRTASAWLQERLQQLGEQSAAAEQAVVAFKQQNNIVSADGKRLDGQKLANLNTRLVTARTHTSDVLTRLTRLESIIHTWKPNGTLDASVVSDELTSPILTKLAPAISRSVQKGDGVFCGRDHRAVVFTWWTA